VLVSLWELRRAACFVVFCVLCLGVQGAGAAWWAHAVAVHSDWRWRRVMVWGKPEAIWRLVWPGHNVASAHEGTLTLGLRREQNGS
jgi:hypothetical protein